VDVFIPKYKLCFEFQVRKERREDKKDSFSKREEKERLESEKREQKKNTYLCIFSILIGQLSLH
jgi:hypothetical protein